MLGDGQIVGVTIAILILIAFSAVGLYILRNMESGALTGRERIAMHIQRRRTERARVSAGVGVERDHGATNGEATSGSGAGAEESV